MSCAVAFQENPTCEAQFRRMLQIGVVSRLYDPHLFPTPEKAKASYQVTDEKTGKLITLPHPVTGLRIWNAEKQAYEQIDPLLTGAPTDADAPAYWVGMMQSFEDKHGADYIKSLLAGKS